MACPHCFVKVERIVFLVPSKRQDKPILVHISSPLSSDHRTCMSPVSPVFYTVETMSFVLKFNVNSLTLENKMSMIVGRALKISLSFRP